MRQVAADRSAVADLRVRDVGQRLMDKGQVPCNPRIVLEVPVLRERSDAEIVRSAIGLAYGDSVFSMCSMKAASKGGRRGTRVEDLKEGPRARGRRRERATRLSSRNS